MLPYAEVHVLDRNAEHLGVTTDTLMENAGKAVADTVSSKYSLLGKKVLVLCGTGNNAGMVSSPPDTSLARVSKSMCSS